MSEWPVIDPLPSYGRGRDHAGGRYSSLVGGSNLTDVIITGMHAITIKLILRYILRGFKSRWDIPWDTISWVETGCPASIPVF